MMTFDIDFIRRHYATFSQRVAEIRNRKGGALTLSEKILFAHLYTPTSSIDTRTEKLVQEGMDRLMKGRTTFVIAHRLSTIQDADLIVVLDQGVVVEMGDHKELIQKGGVYNKLYQTQFAGLDT